MNIASSPNHSHCPIKLPFTREAAIQVLEWGAHPEWSAYSHKQIAQWCGRFWNQYIEVDTPPEIEQLLPIMADVDAQWDLYLVNTYPLEMLRSNTFEIERIPVEWFEEWLSRAKA